MVGSDVLVGLLVGRSVEPFLSTVSFNCRVGLVDSQAAQRGRTPWVHDRPAVQLVGFDAFANPPRVVSLISRLVEFAGVFLARAPPTSPRCL